MHYIMNILTNYDNLLLGFYPSSVRLEKQPLKTGNLLFTINDYVLTPNFGVFYIITNVFDSFSHVMSIFEETWLFVCTRVEEISLPFTK